MRYRALRQNLTVLKRDAEKEEVFFEIYKSKECQELKGHQREWNGRPKGLYIDLEEVATAPSNFRDSLVVHGRLVYGKWSK